MSSCSCFRRISRSSFIVLLWHRKPPSNRHVLLASNVTSNKRTIDDLYLSWCVLNHRNRCLSMLATGSAHISGLKHLIHSDKRPPLHATVDTEWPYHCKHWCESVPTEITPAVACFLFLSPSELIRLGWSVSAPVFTVQRQPPDVVSRTPKCVVFCSFVKDESFFKTWMCKRSRWRVTFVL